MAQIGEPDRWWTEPAGDPLSVPLPEETPAPAPEPVPA